VVQLVAEPIGSSARCNQLASRTASQLHTRAQIDELEASLRASIDTGEVTQSIADGETDEGSAQCQHYFADGAYARALWIPAGTCVVGKVHKQTRICVIAAGKCRFIDEFRSEEVEAPWIGEFKAESKTAVYAITDTLWIAVLGTELKDPQQIVRELTAPSHAALLLGTEEKVTWPLPQLVES
jgi:hypothetical protein